MKSHKFWSLLAGIALLLALIPQARAAAAPLPQANLLANGSMESFAANGVATGWDPWWEEVANPGTGSLDYVVKPNWVQEANPVFVQSGGASQHIGRNWDPWHAGIRQTISVSPGATVRITAYGRVFATTPDYPAPSESAVQSRMQIGAEPNGSIEWYSPSVKWSGTGNPHDTWGSFTLDVTAGNSGKVTIFLAANFRGDSRYHLDAWWDNVTAVATGSAPANTAAPGATNPPAQATNPPAPTSAGPAATGFVTPTPGSDGVIIYVVQPGDTLWRIAAITGLTVDQLMSMNGLTSNLISEGQRLIIGYTTPEAPAATPTPTLDPNATPEPTTGAATSEATSAGAGGTPVAVASATSPGPAAKGTVCVLLWNDTNGDGVRGPTEALLAGGQLSVVNTTTGEPVEAYTTDGISEPHCFEGLAPGSYSFSSVPPAGYNPTTRTSIPYQVEAGLTAALEFGAQPGGGVTQQPSGGGPSNALRTSLMFAGGVVFLLLAAGVAGMMFMRRGR